MTPLPTTRFLPAPRRLLALALSCAVAGLWAMAAAPAASAKPKHQDCDAEAAEERGCQPTPLHPETGGKSHTATARLLTPAPRAASAAANLPPGKAATRPAPAAPLRTTP